MSRSLALYIAIRPEVERDIPLRFMFEAGAIFCRFFISGCAIWSWFGLLGSFLGCGFGVMFWWGLESGVGRVVGLPSCKALGKVGYVKACEAAKQP